MGIYRPAPLPAGISYFVQNPLLLSVIVRNVFLFYANYEM